MNVDFLLSMNESVHMTNPEIVAPPLGHLVNLLAPVALPVVLNMSARCVQILDKHQICYKEINNRFIQNKNCTQLSVSSAVVFRCE